MLKFYLDLLRKLLQEKVQPPPLEKIISFKDPTKLFADNWFALVFEITIYYIFYKAFQNAKQRGTKETFLLVSATIAALALEILQQIPHSGYQLWWYHLGVINLLKHKVPAHVPCFVALLFYYSDYVTRNTKLPPLTRSFVNACLATSLVFPCLSLAPNLLMIMFHFDDEIFRDKIMNVPFCQLTYLFLLFFHIRHVFAPFFDEIEPHERNYFRHVRCSFQSGIIAGLFSFIEMYLTYLVFRLILPTHTVLCFLFVFITIAWLAKNELSTTDMKGYTTIGIFDTMKMKEWKYLLAFFAFILLVPIVVNPENLKSNNERLEIGPCDTLHSITNMSPLESMRKRYICPKDTAQHGYDFHCVPQSELNLNVVKSEYTLCGVAYSNLLQMVVILVIHSVMCLLLFHYTLSFSLKTDEEVEMMSNGKKIE